MSVSNPGGASPNFTNEPNVSTDPAIDELRRAVDNVEESAREALDALENSELFMHASRLFGLFKNGESPRLRPLPSLSSESKSSAPK